MSPNWRTVKIFVSSTFRDMHAERDHLVKFVFPELRERLQRHRVYLDDIDLRWGITGEQVESEQVIELCLRSIDECRPFFIGLLGGRYGYPIAHFAADLVRGHAWLADHEGDSVTSIEIQYGALRAATSKSQAFFYFREDAVYPTIPATELPDYVEADPRLQARLAELKERIRSSGAHVFNGYPARWNPAAFNSATRTQGRLDGLESFGNSVRDDLWAAIKMELALNDPIADFHPALDVLEERNSQSRFVESRLRVYEGREEIETALTAYVEGEDMSPCLLLGPAGSGKSSALAHFAVALRQQHPEWVILSHFVASGAQAADSTTMLRRLCLELRENIVRGPTDGQALGDPSVGGGLPVANSEDEIPVEAALLPSAFSRLLEAAPPKARLVIVIDALDQLREATERFDLEWFPVLRDGDKIVLSCSTNTPRGRNVLDVLNTRRHSEIAVGPLSDPERIAIIRSVPSLSSKMLDAQQIALLLANSATKNPLFLRVALEELRIFGSFELLNARIANLPAPGATDETFEDSELIIPLFQQIIERLESDFDRDVVRSTLTSLAVARRGLLERELRELLSGTPQATDLFPLLRQLRAYLTSQSGCLTFFHQALHDAVDTRYLSEKDNVIAAHAKLSDFFIRQPLLISDAPNIRKLDEQTWQHGRAHRWGQLSHDLTDLAFLETKTEAGLLPDLVLDFETALEAFGRDSTPVTVKQETASVRAQFQLLALLRDAIRRDMNFLQRYPSTLFQCLWNSCWWHDCPGLNQHLVQKDEKNRALQVDVAGPGGPQSGTPKLYVLLEKWRMEKEHREPGFIWVRSLRPPRTPLVKGVQTFSEPESDVSGMHVDARRLTLYLRDGFVRRWDIATGRELRSFKPPGEIIGIRSYGQEIVTSRGVWDIVTGRQLVQLRIDEAGVLSPDGKLLAITKKNGFVEVWDIQQNRLSASFAAYRPMNESHDCLFRVRFLPKTGHIVTSPGANCDEITLKVWDIQQVKPLASFIAYRPKNASHDWSFGVYFLPNTEHIVTSAGSNCEEFSVKVWDWRNNKLLGHYPGHRSAIGCLTISNDGNWIVSSSGSPGEIDLQIVDLRDDIDKARPRAPMNPMTLQGFQQQLITHMEFSSDGSKLLIGMRFNYEIDVWHFPGFRRLSRINVNAPISLLFVIPGSDKMVHNGENFSICIRDILATPTRADRLDCECNVTTIQFSHDGNRIITGAERGELWVWDAPTGCRIAETEYWLTGSPLFAISPDGQRMAAYAYPRPWDEGEPWVLSVEPLIEDSIRLMAVNTCELICKLIGHDAKISSLTYARDGNIVSASLDGTICFWNAKAPEKKDTNGTGRVYGIVIPSEKLQAHAGGVRSFRLSQDGCLLVSWGADKAIKIWQRLPRQSKLWALWRRRPTDSAPWEQIGTVPVESEDYFLFAISPDGRLVVWDAGHGVVNVWDCRSRSVSRSLRYAAPDVVDRLSTLRFSPNGRTLTCRYHDETIKNLARTRMVYRGEKSLELSEALFDMETGEPLASDILSDVPVKISIVGSNTVFFDRNKKEIARYPIPLPVIAAQPGSKTWAGSWAHSPMLSIKQSGGPIEIVTLEGWPQSGTSAD
jgi:WD40 repeat protein